MKKFESKKALCGEGGKVHLVFTKPLGFGRLAELRPDNPLNRFRYA